MERLEDGSGDKKLQKRPRVRFFLRVRDNREPYHAIPYDTHWQQVGARHYYAAQFPSLVKGEKVNVRA